jgi:hypothetical protein
MTTPIELPPAFPPPVFPPPVAANGHRNRAGKPKRPKMFILVAAVLGLRLGRRVLFETYGIAGAVVGLVAFLVILTSWRVIVRRRARAAGVAEYTPEAIAKQFARSGAAAPAFAEDGTLLGASLYAVNQRSKVIEVTTEFEVFSSTGAKLGHVRQIGQGRFKRFLRFFTSFDQFLTHHLDITDSDDVVVLRITRPAKLFKSRIEVFDGHDVFLGRVVQRNIFGKINFGMYSADGEHIATLKAENWRAWDFRVELWNGAEVARVTKTWEGLARTVLSNADTYVVRIHQPLNEPLRSLVCAVALSIDLALKQDARGLGA